MPTQVLTVLMLLRYELFIIESSHHVDVCIYLCIVLSHRAIERTYKEYCEQNSKEQPEYLDCGPSEDLMFTDSAVWAKVHMLIM